MLVDGAGRYSESASDRGGEQSLPKQVDDNYLALRQRRAVHHPARELLQLDRVQGHSP
jgi:hypothetical protein